MAFSTQLLSALTAGRNSGAIQQAIQQATAGQNKANAANEARYTQGLGELTGAEDLIKQNGAAGLNRLEIQAQDNAGKTTQSVVNRGLTNTTISDALQRGVQQDANDARQRLQEGINSQQAQAKGNIAQYIANRNDVGPDASLLSGLVQGAASDSAGAKRTGTVTRQSVPGLGGSASSNGLPSSFGGGSTGGGPGGYYVNGGGGTPQIAPLSGSQTNGSISSALNPVSDSGGGSIVKALDSGGVPNTPPPSKDAQAAMWNTAMSDAVQSATNSKTVPNRRAYGSEATGQYFSEAQFQALPKDQQQAVLSGRKI